IARIMLIYARFPGGSTMQPIPTINVNLSPCDCGYVESMRNAARRAASQGGIIESLPSRHTDGCAAAPVRIPLSLAPHRSFSCTVVLGACKQIGCVGDTRRDGHAQDCPARPV